MKLLNYKVKDRSYRLIFLIFLCCTTFLCYGESQSKSDIFYSKIVSLKVGMTKEEVKMIMGEPYKISFTTNERKEFIEDLYYKISIYMGKWYVITYQCIFVNSKLNSLLQKESRFDTPNTEVTISN